MVIEESASQLIRRGSLMKKVRYAAGAIGALGAVPALGLMTTTATAATHVPARTGKIVSLINRAPDAPDAACLARSTSNGGTDIFVKFYYSRDIGCVGSLTGHLLNHTNTGWWMRVRSYHNNHLSWSRFNKFGHIHNGNGSNSIQFSSLPHHSKISNVCEAMVRAASSSKVKYGPICELTGF
jgi:hypothetical protein